MDVTSYLLGKNASSGGGGDTSEYFMDELLNTPSNTAPATNVLVKRLPTFKVASGITSLASAFYYNTKLEKVDGITNTSQVTTTANMFLGCNLLTQVPLFDTSGVTTCSNMFKNCYALEEVPVYNLSNVTDASSMFTSCSKLSDKALNNIMAMCINMTKMGTKTLQNIGLSSTQRNKCITLSNYQAFLNAGWTIS